MQPEAGPREAGGGLESAFPKGKDHRLLQLVPVLRVARPGGHDPSAYNISFALRRKPG
jgi:hypothetical protein